ncbi:uncharacterized protein TOT_030000730 [Theileria orientalis strain Shintoku]|uniref:Lipoprotein n=1 Tax=Theileria orientalis strain Shintoku TaxID=869250 RepID=J4C8V9_THEOR|nr:uncharacterized protein TOT_030000730 [Theileria orientalis strain Shintoku]BAM41468.1 uncharacterized protein TOT_030000730 [Theileria orientalis strain Shintoku]|eukprot:XP_009691769.1 uncharacterized protein TOT_030000730 [Theileria orientalis strain Shintoku]
MNTRNIYFALFLCLLGFKGCYADDDDTTIKLEDTKGTSSTHPAEESSGEQSKPKVTPITFDINDQKESNQIRYQYDSSEDSHTFETKEGFAIEKVLKGTTVLWESKDFGGQYGSRVIIKRDANGEKTFIVDYITTIPKDQDKETYFKGVTTDSKATEIDLAIPHTESDSDDEEHISTNLVVLNLSDKVTNHIVHYEQLPNGVEIFTAFEPYRFILVTKGSYTVWRYQHGQYPNKAYILKDENANPYCRLEFPKPELKSFRLPTVRSVKLPRNDEEPVEMVDIPYNIDPAVMNQLTQRHKVDLDVHSKLNSFNCDYQRKGRSHVYTAKTGYLFHTVRVGNMFLWTATDIREYAHRVEFFSYKFPGMFDVNIFHFPGGKKKFIKNVGPWRQVELSRLNLYTVNVDSVFDTFGYVNSFDGTFGVFDAKRPFLFDRIIKYNGPGSNVTNIWQARNYTEYVKRVVIDGAHPYQNTNFILLVMNDNKRKILLRLNGIWTEVPY